MAVLHRWFYCSMFNTNIPGCSWMQADHKNIFKCFGIIMESFCIYACFMKQLWFIITIGCERWFIIPFLIDGIFHLVQYHNVQLVKWASPYHTRLKSLFKSTLGSYQGAVVRLRGWTVWSEPWYGADRFSTISRVQAAMYILKVTIFIYWGTLILGPPSFLFRLLQ